MTHRLTLCQGLCAFLVATLAWAAGGSGTADDPYVITTLDELQAIQNDLAAHYVLGSDIDASETALWNGGRGFTPIGTVQEPFSGVLDGRGHTITGLYIDRRDEASVGLIGVAFGATLRAIRIQDAEVYGNYDTGILVGRASLEALLIRCSVTGSLILRAGSGDAKSGGLVGGMNSGSRVEECYSDVEVSASGRRQVGGLVGYLRGVETTRPRASIRNSYAAGTVWGNGWKQGNLLGDADNGIVDRSYSSGLGKALIGFNYRNPTITNSYWDAERGAPTSTYGGLPMTTEQMMSRATFAGWDFDTVWGIEEGEGYPFLRFDAPFQMAPFSVANAHLLFAAPGKDHLHMIAYFGLDPLSDGMEPSLEDVRVQVGGYTETLPAGALTCLHWYCYYRGTGSGIVQLVIGSIGPRRSGWGSHFVLLWARDVDLSGTANPAVMSLRIGNDEGSTTQRLSGVLGTSRNRIPGRR